MPESPDLAVVAKPGMSSDMHGHGLHHVKEDFRGLHGLLVLCDFSYTKLQHATAERDDLYTHSLTPGIKGKREILLQAIADIGSMAGCGIAKSSSPTTSASEDRRHGRRRRLWRALERRQRGRGELSCRRGWSSRPLDSGIASLRKKRFSSPRRRR